MTRFIVVFAVGFSSFSSSAVERGPWEKIREEAGIEVRRREVSGSTLHEFLGRGRVEAPVSRVVAVIRDTPARTEWMANCNGSQALEQGEMDQTIYNRTRAPWPVADRDVVLYAKPAYDEAAGELVISFESTTHPDAPPVEGVVRMPFLRGHWRLRPVDGGKATQVEYQVHADPGGALPAWLSNLVSRKLPFETLASLRGQVKRRSYPDIEARVEAHPRYRQLVRAAGGVALSAAAD